MGQPNAWTSALLLAGLAACIVPAGGEAAATPQRPTLSSDTNTTAEGTFEVETGASWDPSDSFGLPTVVKFGSGPRTEVFVGGSPYVYVSQRGEDEQGIGDVTVGLRHRLVDETDGSPGAALQAAVKLPTADEERGLGSGEVDASFAGILARSAGSVGLTGYYSLDVLGDPDGNTALGHSLALAAGLPLADRVGAFGELAGVWIPELDTDPIFTTLGLTFSPSPTLVFDAAIVLGLNDDAPDTQVMIGLTRNLGSRFATPGK